MAATAPLKHSPQFSQRRTQNWLALGFTYAAMYMARYNFPLANKALSDAYGFSKTQVGTIITISTLIYGLSAIFNGPIADRLGGRKAMLIGAGGAFFFNLVFGFGAYLGVVGTPAVMLAYFSAVWALNMYFQSYSALALIKVNSGWFHVSERGVFSAIFGSMIQSGRFLVFLLLGLPMIALLPWQWKFFIPSVVVAVMWFVTWRVVQDSPKDAGLGEFDPEDASSGDTEAITFSYVARKVFTNPIAITIAIAEFCTGLVRKGFEEWFPRYMQEVQHLELSNPIFQRNALAIVGAGIAGAFIAGYASDKVFGHRRAPVAFIGYAIQVVCLFVVWKAPGVNAVVIAFMLNSLAISMVHSMLSGTASMDFGGKRAAATAAGLFDGMQYVGGSVMGVGMGWLLDHYGWSVWGPSMMGFSAIGGILMLTLWNARPRKSGGH
ncbi:MAG: MFS transporter [Candidatus Eisenbacteria bacterium]|uniref:MFS transporter n=1 Tax=Eiseniibacteriota bacterium TaxID=2212470 RepID=A0A849SAT1_UNCEI|nr:MFS transporter [Candidatus Eisenbacteria bacterium]